MYLITATYFTFVRIFCSKQRTAAKNLIKSTTIANNNWLVEQATLTQLNEISIHVESLCAVCQKLNVNDTKFMTLKLAFKTEATKFMKKFHEERLKKIEMILENETWSAAKVPIQFQYLLNRIVDEGNKYICTIVQRGISNFILQV